MATKQMSRSTESELLLNIKDIERIKSDNADAKFAERAITIEKSIEKYNSSYIKALRAPTPNISLHYNEVLVRAVPLEIKSKGGIILSAGTDNHKIADQLNRMVDAVKQTQEILMVGNLITEEERDAGIRPGRYAKIKLDRFRTLSDRHAPGMIETTYELPIEVIKGEKYMIIDKRDILYTTDSDE